MLELSHLLLLLILSLLGFGLMAGIRLKEAAQKAVESRCKQLDVQLLDGTIALRRLGIGRNSHGRLVLTRRFQFEFTATGADRNIGWIDLRGRQIRAIELTPHRFAE